MSLWPMSLWPMSLRSFTCQVNLTLIGLSTFPDRRPVHRAHHDHLQLALGSPDHLRLRLGAGSGEDRGRGVHHGADDEVAQRLQVLRAPPQDSRREPEQVHGQLTLEELELVADRLSYDARTGRPLTVDERELRSPFADVARQDRHGPRDDLVDIRLLTAYVAQHLSQRDEALVDQGEAELVDRREVPVE